MQTLSVELGSYMFLYDWDQSDNNRNKQLLDDPWDKAN